MDRTQVGATLAGLALVGGALFGAVAATQGSGDVSLANTPVLQQEAVVVSAPPAAVAYAEDVVISSQASNEYDEDVTVEAGEYEADTYDEYSEDAYEYEDDEDTYPDHDEYEDDDYEEDDEDDD